MKYPAIYESEDGSAYLHASKSLFSHLVNGNSYEWRNIDCADEHEKDKNITTEYLANTYGEVKSKAHAEFIVKLAEGHGIKTIYPWYDGAFFNFYTDIIGRLFLGFFGESTAKGNGEKQITIPLPPESITNTPKESKVQKLNSVTHHKLKAEADEHILIKPSAIDFEVHDNLNLSFNTTESVSINGDKKLLITVTTNEPEENAGINLMFGDADKCKEWPCVNDEVLINIDFDKYDVKYGKEVNGENGVVRSIFKDGDATVYAVSVDGTCYCFVRGLLSKPKTPEEKERDEIEKYFKELFRVVMSNPLSLITGDADKAIDHIFENLEITKKPQ